MSLCPCNRPRNCNFIKKSGDTSQQQRVKRSIKDDSTKATNITIKPSLIQVDAGLREGILK